MVYLCKFDENGRRGATYPEDMTMSAERKAELISDGFIETPEEDWKLYCDTAGGVNGTGYIRDTETGKPVDAPAHVPTKGEKLAALDAQYDADKAELVKYYGEAGLMGDTSLQAELRDEMAELDAEYAEARKAIEEGSDE